MPQHGLHAAEVGSSFKQMRSKAMAQNVRREIPKNTGAPAMPRQQLPKGLTGHGAPARGHKEVPAAPPFENAPAGRFYVLAYGLHGRSAHRDHALLVALPGR